MDSNREPAIFPAAPPPARPRRRFPARTLAIATGLAATAALGAALVRHPPVEGVLPGEVAIRVSRVSGGATVIREGSFVSLPGIHSVRRIPIRTQIYRSQRSARASSEAPFKSSEGLSIGVELAVEYAIDPGRIEQIARGLPENLGRDFIEPTVDGIGHRVFAEHTVREIFATARIPIQREIEQAIRERLEPKGFRVESVSLGSIDLPGEYREGVERLLAEELATDKMQFTLALKEKQVKETELEAEARKVARAKQAEAAAQEEVIAARGRVEAMAHLLPLKEKEIEQQRLESEAERVRRLKLAETEAQARAIEADAEANTRRKLAEADAYRIEVTGKAASEQLARDSTLIARNPLLIQKTVADKLSDKIQVIVAPPPRTGFFAEGFLQTGPARPQPGAADDTAAFEASHADGEGESR